MNLRDLRYLVALADLRHFGRAADACFVSQPTLSTQIRKLGKISDDDYMRIMGSTESGVSIGKDLGVDQFAIYLQHDDKDRTLLEYGERIIPAIRDTVHAKS